MASWACKRPGRSGCCAGVSLHSCYREKRERNAIPWKIYPDLGDIAPNSWLASSSHTRTSCRQNQPIKIEKWEDSKWKWLWQFAIAGTKRRIKTVLVFHSRGECNPNLYRTNRAKKRKITIYWCRGRSTVERDNEKRIYLHTKKIQLCPLRCVQSTQCENNNVRCVKSPVSRQKPVVVLEFWLVDCVTTDEQSVILRMWATRFQCVYLLPLHQRDLVLVTNSKQGHKAETRAFQTQELHWL